MHHLLILLLTFTNVYIMMPVLLLYLVFGSATGIVFIMFLSSSVNNVVGLYVPINYLLFAMAFLGFAIKYPSAINFQRGIVPFLQFLVVLQVYGLFLSILSMQRIELITLIEPVVSTVFSIIFPIAGAVISSFAVKNERATGKLITVLLVYIIVVMTIQKIFGPLSLLPAFNEESYEGKSQLVSVEKGNTIRAFGPLLGPNALGLLLLFFIIIIATLNNRHGLLKQLMAGGLAFLTYSKSAVACIFMFFFSALYIRSSSVFKLITIFGSLVFILVGLQYKDSMVSQFRIGDGVSKLGVRTTIYNHMTKDFPAEKYLLGIGPHTWKAYFVSELGVDVQDPHSFLFSVPGGYGVAGVLFYLLLGWRIIKNALFRENIKAKTAAIGLLIVVFVKDIATIPTPLGTTHFTFFFWFIFGLMLYYEREEYLGKKVRFC